jgi:hypothetical protein
MKCLSSQVASFVGKLSLNEMLKKAVEKVGIGKKSARVWKKSFQQKSAKNQKTTTNIKKYKIYSFFSKF